VTSPGLGDAPPPATAAPGTVPPRPPGDAHPRDAPRSGTTALGVRGLVARLDAGIERRLARRRHPGLDHVAYALSSAADHSLLWFFAGSLVAWRRSDPRFAVRFAAAMLGESALTNLGVKPLFRRRRPPGAPVATTRAAPAGGGDPPSPAGPPDGAAAGPPWGAAAAPAAAGRLPYGMRRPITSSFPSGHAAAAFAAAALLGAGARRPAVVGWHLLATAVAASRVYVRLHHPSDVVAGAALGAAYGRLARRWLRPLR
jgi:undecaprenyl-diphosphatase